MKYIGENAIKKLISLIKGDLATKQPTITASGLLKGDGAGTVTAADTQEATLVDVPNGLLKGDGTTISAAVADMDYMVPPTGGTTGQILKKTETGTEWADESGGSSSTTQTVTLLTSGWAQSGNGYEQTVNVTGVLANETKQLITPVPAMESQSAYYDASIKCTGQAANSLTFTADTIPTADLTVYVVIQDVAPPQ